MKTRSYSEMYRLDTLLSRFSYLKLNGFVGDKTFGYDRWINQQFYRSHQWRRVRLEVIRRDEGCDLGIDGYQIHKGLYIHHMNPMTRAQVIEGDESIFDPEFLITVSHSTHNAIHYGDETQLPGQVIVRTAGDTRLW
jgi:hypothetical protein